MVVWQVDDDGGGLSVGRRERERGRLLQGGDCVVIVLEAVLVG